MVPKGCSEAGEHRAPSPATRRWVGGGRSEPPPLGVPGRREREARQSGRNRHKCKAAPCPRLRGPFHQCHLGMDINRSIYCPLCFALPHSSPLPFPFPAVLLRRMERVGSAGPPPSPSSPGMNATEGTERGGAELRSASGGRAGDGGSSGAPFPIAIPSLCRPPVHRPSPTPPYRRNGRKRHGTDGRLRTARVETAPVGRVILR